MVQQEYIVSTPSIEEMYLSVKEFIRLRLPGGVVVGSARFGKTIGVRYVTHILKADYPEAVALNFNCRQLFSTFDENESHSEDIFFSALLDAVGRPAALMNGSGTNREKLNERLMEMVDHAGYDWFILFADEAQCLEVIELEWLRSVHDELESRGVHMITLLVGQPLLLRHKRSLRGFLQTQVVSLSKIEEMRFQGIMSVVDLEKCLAGYDEARFPRNANNPYTQLFLPAAYDNGFRMINQATEIWAAFMDVHEAVRCEFALEIPIQFIARSVEIALFEHADHDAHNFVMEAHIWRNVIAKSNFAVHEEWRMCSGE